MKIITSVLFLTSLISPVLCQTEKQLQPSDLKQKTLITEPVTLHKGFFRAGTGISYGVIDRIFNSSGEKEYITSAMLSNNFFINFSLQYGLTDRLQVEVSNSLINNKDRGHWKIVSPESNTDIVTNPVLRTKGIGDMDLFIKYQIIPEKENGSSLAIKSFITFPTGKKNYSDIKSFLQYDKPSGNGNFTLGNMLLYRKLRYPYSYSGYIGYNYNFTGSKMFYVTDTKEVKFKYGNRFDIGGSFNIHLNDWIVFANDLSCHFTSLTRILNSTNDKIDPSWGILYQPWLVFQVKRFRLVEAITMPVKGKNIGADPLYTFLVQYVF